MVKIGFADFDLEGFCTWNENYIPENKKTANPSWVDDHWDYFYERQGLFKDCLNIMDEHIFKSSSVEDLKALITHLSDTGEKLQLFYYDETACVIGYEDRQFLMNPAFVKPEYLKDYSRLTTSEMKSLTGTVSEAGLLPATMEDSSIKSLSDKKKEAEDALETARAELRAREDAIRQEMQKKLEEMKALMQGKMDELNEKVKEFEKEIFILESQIFSIRCYTGEVIKFHQIREGKKADPSEPLVLYQKIRFLDEELGKHISIFDFDGEDDTRLIPLLKHRDDLAELFAPGKKSLTILRTSRTGKFVAAHDKIKNMMAEYEQYHGKQLSLLLRDGENLYISWLDADKIKINEENAFYSMSRSYEEKAENEDSRITEKATDIHEALSRYYLLAILQGMIDAKNIISFPEPVNVIDPDQKYVIFSLAKGWISESKYGTLQSMLDKSKDIAPRKGDHILTITGLYPEDSGAHSNDRGIGYNNRTWGSHLRGKEIYPVNLILFDAVVEYDFEAVKIKEVPIQSPIYVTANGQTTTEMQDDIRYDVTNEVMFTGKSCETIPAEIFKELKDDAAIKCSVINRICAVGCDYKVDMYYQRKATFHDGYEEARYYKPDGFDKKMQLSGKELYAKHITGVRVVKKIPHTYVSVKQQGYGSYSNNFKSTEYYVNFEVYDHEYIPLTFLCSSWIEEVIQNGSIGHITFPGARPSFADMLPYLHLALEDVKTREEKEKEMLLTAGGGQFIEENADWDAILCEWKIKNNIHELTETRARRFIRTAAG